MIILMPEDIQDIFAAKIKAAEWLEKNGNETDREVASVTRQTLEHILLCIVEKDQTTGMSPLLLKSIGDIIGINATPPLILAA